MRAMLLHCLTCAGIREANFPDETETMFLLTFIRTHYGNHSEGEIRLAFDMAVSGKLDVEATAYENFSALYFGNVMSAFRKWAAEEHNQNIREKEAKEAQQEEKNTESVDWSDQWAKLVKLAKNGIIRKEFINTDLYGWLMKREIVDLETGEVTPKYEFSKEEIWNVIGECLQQYRFEMRCALKANEDRGAVNPPDMIKLVELMECFEVDAAGNITDQHPWRKNEVIMSTLCVMAKQEFVRQIAVSEAAEL